MSCKWMEAVLRLNVLMLFLSMVCVSAEAMADRMLFGHNDSPFYNIYRPQTKEEIYSSYRALVDTRNGVNELEARLIAQYKAITHDLDHGYDVAKPKVIEETTIQWKVRIPSKFSINDRKRPPDFVMCIEKRDGKIACFGEGK